MKRLDEHGYFDTMEFTTMPVAIKQIMELAPVTTVSLDKKQVVDAVYDYLKGLK